MNRKILIQVTAPTVVIGLLLFGVCLVGARSLSRLQDNRAKIVSEHFRSMEAAQELEINVRQLRFQCLLYLLAPAPERLEGINAIHRAFEASLQKAREAANTEGEQTLVQAIEAGYREYRDELARLRAEVTRDGARKFDVRELEQLHPIRHVVDPCREYFRLNQDMAIKTNQDSDALNRQMQTGMLFLGLGGPLSGLIIGFGIARSLSRSIYQLRVRVQDMAQRLEPRVASVHLAADGDLHGLDRQMEKIVQRVAEVTERLQQQQREMLRAEQLSALGQLAASVAHEVRNPLTSIKLLVGAALRSRNSKALSLDDLEVIHDEVNRLEQTVRGFLDFARPAPPRRSVCDLREVAAQAADLVRPHARQQNVELLVHEVAEPLPADVDRSQLGTVLVNLFLNALDAMPHGGRLEVELGSAAGSHCLRVTDTGAGIAPDMLPRLFTPFVSSKPTGTGLGLSICRRIVEEHGGHIRAANRPEGGACFTITLPVAESQESGIRGQEPEVSADRVRANL
jgi:signal transduction histidine kinase